MVLWSIDSKTPGEFTQMGTPILTRISWIVWCYPGMTEEEFYRGFREFWDKHAGSDPELMPFTLELVPTHHHVKPWETEVDHPALRETVRSFSQYMGHEPAVGGAPFSCDLALYGDAGNMPGIILGPRGDNLHAPDEWVLVDDILSLTGIFALLACRWSG